MSTITPEMIVELRRQYPMCWSRSRAHHPFGHLAYSTLDINDLLDALESSRAEVQRLTEEARRSDAGRVEVPERAAWLTIEEMANEIEKGRATHYGIWSHCPAHHPCRLHAGARRRQPRRAPASPPLPSLRRGQS